jgi:hypothetical protein
MLKPHFGLDGGTGSVSETSDLKPNFDVSDRPQRVMMQNKKEDIKWYHVMT